MKLTKKELEIMQILWKQPEPLSARGIVRVNPELSQNTVQSVLSKLLKKGLIENSGYGKTSTNITREYQAVLSEESYLEQNVSRSAINNLLTSFVATNTTLAELDDLERVIEQRKKELRK
ncbi:BlaI/MecI/CopY family transcriptional regulator [Lapidilactobacillus luobeiensis]|uniref:BlaI/MecI/CopY family transcriptional regulator n=1 Tax=Lapidilactobacillus luobeiensis TaxID=2950371 RepID=UPI0021C42CC2|nr:BlaI/MecI/CopY family transcriptional regulator [Lapidilactobacillus luobeiensis]